MKRELEVNGGMGLGVERFVEGDRASRVAVEWGSRAGEWGGGCHAIPPDPEPSRQKKNAYMPQPEPTLGPFSLGYWEPVHPTQHTQHTSLGPQSDKTINIFNELHRIMTAAS